MLQEMVRHGVRVPDDFAIVGYDDIDFAAAAAVPLTSVRKPRQELGRRAAELLFSRLDGHRGAARREVLPTTLIERGSGEISPPAA